MIKRRGLSKIFILGFIFLFLITFVNAQPPFQIQPTFIQGYFIEIPDQEVLKLNKDYTFFFHVFNLSSGVPLGNLSVNCEFNLHNKSSTNIFSDLNLSFDEQTTAFFVEIKGGNFSSKGTYTYVTHCNSENFGGVVSVRLVITPTGDGLEEPESILYFLVTIFAFGIFLGLLILNIRLPYGNPKNENKEFIGIEYKKYVKVALIPLTYVSFIWFFNFLVGLSTNYLTLNMYENLMGSMLLLLTKLAFPLLIVIFLVELVLMVKDINIQKEFKSLWAGN